MAINPRVAARREAEIAFLNEEDERLKDLGEKRKKEAAEKSAATKKEDLPGYDPNKDDEELVFYSEEDREKDDKDEEWYKEFEEEARYLNSPTVRASITRSNNMYNVYKSGEEWLMSDDGGDDLVKGFINNFRSAIGTGVEDFAFWLTENAPWYKPAQNVVEKNTAGKVEEQAQRNFGNAKANGVNGNVVDFLDNTSKNLGYSLFGFKAGDYAQSIGEGFDIYRNLRGQGYSKEEAAKRSLGKTSLAIISTKADDYIGKNNKVDDVLFGKHQKNTGKSKALQNANGDYIIEVKESELYGEPNSITQVVQSKGGIDRNYYGNDGHQIKQISNYGHGHPIEEAMGKHGEHAHDYEFNKQGDLEHQPPRELTYWERKENEDIL